MKKIILTLVGIVLINAISLAQTFTLKSNDIGGQATQEQVFNSFGCTGNNKSPQLHWVNAPQGTQSFAITMYDPDAPTGSGWWHWLVFDIPANQYSLPQEAGNISLNLIPKGTIQSITDFGVPGYGGPCPPQGHGFHQYIITVYALKVAKLGLNKTANPAMVGYYIGTNTLAKASLVMYFKR
ncbi:MAG: YbhB/YbcL family Raf kinase inhibitor-like protein [Sphingobacteriales bacterium]|nr:MAG: YbhB/YbcL family Raf kinase inhibitor-like protein [Sphingobacteriales bacterium]TAF83551.1 MAG: YbhB/YbcL family Raf kinase inhibitor-like protein [Sphingobacteriales bacterium]